MKKNKYKEKLNRDEIQYIAGLLTFAKIEDRVLFTPHGNKILDKLYRIVKKNLESNRHDTRRIV